MCLVSVVRKPLEIIIQEDVLPFGREWITFQDQGTEVNEDLTQRGTDHKYVGTGQRGRVVHSCSSLLMGL